MKIKFGHKPEIELEEIQKKKPYNWCYENSISTNKDYIDLNDCEFPYSQFRVNTIFMAHADTVLFANQMNINHNVSDKMHYDYLFHTIRAKKRYAKSESKENKKIREEEAELISLISSYYKYNIVRSKEIIRILTPEQINIIRQKQEKGGIK